MKLYPDAADLPGLRVLLKIDSGPGRFNPELQRPLRYRGVYMFPGVPNGTEVGQEMDQLYSYLKTIIYRNRDNLYKARNAIAINDTSALGLVDVGHLIFGGEVLLSDGSSIELERAFDMALDEDHLQRAKEKCGYLPSTRAALKSVKVRHEVVVDTGRSSNDDDDGSVDSNYMADPIAELYESIEDLNGSACMILTNSGYTLASKLQLTLQGSTKPGPRTSECAYCGEYTTETRFADESCHCRAIFPCYEWWWTNEF